MTQRRRELKLDKDGKPLGLPFWYEYSRSNFASEEEMIQHLNEQIGRYNEILATLRPGEPHPMAYADEQFDARYQAALHAFEQEQVLERHAERHKPKPQLPPMSPEMRALWNGSPADKEKAKRLLEYAKVAKEQSDAAARHRALGHIREAIACEQRVAQYARAVEDEQRTPYESQAAEQKATLEWGEKELDKMLNWSAEQLQEKLADISGMVQGHREMSMGKHSYVLTGEGDSLRLSKIHHPGFAAKDLAARVPFDDEKLLRNFSCHGVESREEAPPAEVEDESQEASTPDYDNMSFSEFAAAREAEGAKKF